MPKSSKLTHGCTGLVGRQRAGETVLFVVRPRAKVFGERTLDVLAVAVGSIGIPSLAALVVKDTRVGEIVPDDYATAVKSEVSTLVFASIWRAPRMRAARGDGRLTWIDVAKMRMGRHGVRLASRIL